MTVRRLWGVTSLLDQGLPKPALVYWAAQVTAARALDRRATMNAMREEGASRAEFLKFLTDARFEKSGAAKERGSALHAAAEAMALGHDADVAPEIQPYAEQYARFLAEHRPRFLMAEAPVYNATLGYAGTLDAIVELPALPDLGPMILDAKTSDKPADAKSTPPYPDIAIQLALYKRADLVGLAPATHRKQDGSRYYAFDPELEYAPMPETADVALALAVFPDRYTLTPVRVDEEVWQAALAVRDVAHWTTNVAQRVFGPPFDPPSAAGIRVAPAAASPKVARPLDELEEQSLSTERTSDGNASHH